MLAGAFGGPSGLAHSSESRVRSGVKTGDRVPSVTLVFEVLNAVTAPKTHPIIELEVSPGAN